jgi:hypothetical protein
MKEFNRKDTRLILDLSHLCSTSAVKIALLVHTLSHSRLSPFFS